MAALHPCISRSMMAGARLPSYDGRTSLTRRARHPVGQVHATIHHLPRDDGMHWLPHHLSPVLSGPAGPIHFHPEPTRGEANSTFSLNVAPLFGFHGCDNAIPVEGKELTLRHSPDALPRKPSISHRLIVGGGYGVAVPLLIPIRAWLAGLPLSRTPSPAPPSQSFPGLEQHFGGW
jgi:hypothetical protein